MGRSINVSLIDLQIEKEIGLTVDEESKLEEISQFLTGLFKNSVKDTFKYRENTDSSSYPFDQKTLIKDIVRNNEDTLVLYVEVDKKVRKDDTCCVIY